MTSSQDLKLVLRVVLVLTISVMTSEGNLIGDIVDRLVNEATKHMPSVNNQPQNYTDEWSGLHNQSKDPDNDQSSKPEPPEGKTNYVGATINRLGDAIQKYFSNKNKVGKRSLNNRSIPWHHNVALIYDASYQEPFYRNMLSRIFRVISERICLNITDETDNWNSSNKYWFQQNGYFWNSYIRVFGSTSSCSASYGGPINGSYAVIRPCYDSDIMLHEVFHVFGVPHEHTTSIAAKYISTFMQSVSADARDTYVIYVYYQTINFNARSTMVYTSRTFSATGDDTLDFIRLDQSQPDDVTSTENIIIEELNKKYNCSDFCSSPPLDCSPGYATYVKNNCKCVCPPELNSTTNCKKFIDQADKTLKWDIPISVFAAGKNFTCPSGFQPTGWIKFCGNWDSTQANSPVPFPMDGTTIYIPICSKITPTTNIDWNSIPLGGQYCFIKPIGVTCDGVTTLAILEIQSTCTPQTNGSVGDVTINNKNITMNLCCAGSDHTKMTVKLPNETPFQLFTIYSCPYVDGMRTYEYPLVLFTTVSGVYGPTMPLAYIYSSSIMIIMCYFQPAVYGCSQNVTFTANNRKVTITTPGYPGSRPADIRCMYYFNAPAKTKMIVTFNDYDLEINDKMRVKRYNKWSEFYRILNDNPWVQFVTESNFLSMEFWAGFLTTVSNKGVNFTVELLYDADSCFDVDQNGMDYLGTTNVTETNEPCMPWKDTVNCYDSPVNALDSLTGYFESNYCRNSGGKLIQPWCYVYINETSCMKRYCDVCNDKNPVDTVKTSDCITSMSQDPAFCQKAVNRHLCFKSCGMTQAPKGTSGTCSSPPPVPSDGVLIGTVQSSYKAGMKVYVKCQDTADADTVSNSLLLCTKNGWVGPQSACLECPSTWTRYGDRCIYFTAVPHTRAKALEFCKSFNRNGTLMHIRNQTDQDMIRQVRQKTNSLDHKTFFGAYLCNVTTGTWCFLDTTIPMTYYNWAADAANKSSTKTVTYMYEESSTSGRGGKWYSVSINTAAAYTFVCQMDRRYTAVISDKYETCQSVLNDHPNFCKDNNTMNEAAVYCTKSCGLDSGTPQCTEPTSTTYKRTSGTGPITTGDVMTFECKSGYFLTGGDTSRACGIGGSLLGTAPICDNNPSGMDVGLLLVRPKLSTLKSRLAFLLDVEGYRVPFNGTITTWYYHCKNPGLIYFFVARKNGSDYNIIGYNGHTCIRGWRWGFRVPDSNQTSVMAGDIVGAWSGTPYTMTVNNCDSAAIKLINVQSISVQSLQVLLTTISFPTKICILPAFAFRVER